MIFGWGSRKHTAPRLPTVRFDPSRVSEALKFDLWKSVQEFEDLPYGQERTIYAAALQAVMAGGAVNILSDVMVEMGVTKSRAGEVSRYLSGRAWSIMQCQQYLSIGHTHGKWLYSGSACYDRVPTADDLRTDRGHQQASGRVYPIAEGLLVNGLHTHPGMKMGCKCVFGPAIKGIDF